MMRFVPQRILRALRIDIPRWTVHNLNNISSDCAA
jgi:hypothetical protein